MKNYLIALMILALSACSNYGEKIEVNGTEVYYKDGVTKEMAMQLGEFLDREEFSDGSTKSVQFYRNETSGVLTFKMVTTEEFASDPSYEMIFKEFARNLRTEFDQPVDFLLADNSFETLKTFAAADLPEVIKAKGTDVHYTENVSRDMAEKLAAFLIESEFSDDTPKSVMLDKEGNTYYFRMVVKEGFAENTATEFIFKAYGIQMKNELFKGSDMKFVYCDNKFNTIKELDI